MGAIAMASHERYSHRVTAMPGTAGQVALVVDDNPADQFLAERILSRAGYLVITADTAEEGLALAEGQRPDFVIADVMLPGADGYSLIAAIRARYPDVYIPVLFITGLSDEGDLLKCFDAGGDDVMCKPISESMLRAKLAVAQRLRELNQTLAAQRDELARYRAEMVRDMGIAKSIIDNLGSERSLAMPNVSYRLQPVETLNGDLIAGARSPIGAQCFILGDFTGHGLPAAIAVLVVHGIFSAMVAKGYSIDHIAAELNRKMRQLLPRDRFLAAALIEIYPDSGTVSVWNGGMPEIVLRRADGRPSRAFRSTRLPLGILAPEDFGREPVRRQMSDGDALFVYSDGVTEAMNGAGEMFGRERLQACLTAHGSDTDVIERVSQAVAAHVGEVPQADDISMLHVRFNREEMLSFQHISTSAPSSKPPARWFFAAELSGDALRAADPLPALAGAMDGLQGFGPRVSEICLIIAELFANALEHGLLGLDSSVKAQPNGYAQYYSEREARLATLDRGWIRIELRHEPHDNGGLLEIRVRQSSGGFDVDAEWRARPNADGFVGRGMRLVRSLAQSLDYADGGREAIVHYAWSNPPPV